MRNIQKQNSYTGLKKWSQNNRTDQQENRRIFLNTGRKMDQNIFIVCRGSGNKNKKKPFSESDRNLNNLLIILYGNNW